MRRGNVPRSWYRLWYAYVVRPFEWMEVTWLLYRVFFLNLVSASEVELRKTRETKSLLT